MRSAAWVAVVAAVGVMAACTPGGGADASESASPSPSPMVTESALPSPSPSPSPEPAPSETSASDDGEWVNGYILPGVDDVHFGPAWGPTWLYQYTIGEEFSSWPAGDVVVTGACPWYAGFNQSDLADFYAGAVGDPRGEQGTAYHFEINNPGGAVYPPLNAEGMGPGSAMDDVRAAYPGASETTFDDPSWGTVTEIDVYQASTDTHMYFWANDPHGTVERIQVGYFPQGNSWRGHICGD